MACLEHLLVEQLMRAELGVLLRQFRLKRDTPGRKWCRKTDLLSAVVHTKVVVSGVMNPVVRNALSKQFSLL